MSERRHDSSSSHKLKCKKGKHCLHHRCEVCGRLQLESPSGPSTPSAYSLDDASDAESECVYARREHDEHRGPRTLYTTHPQVQYFSEPGAPGLRHRPRAPPRPRPATEPVYATPQKRQQNVVTKSSGAVPKQYHHSPQQHAHCHRAEPNDRDACTARPSSHKHQQEPPPPKVPPHGPSYAHTVRDAPKVVPKAIVHAQQSQRQVKSSQVKLGDGALSPPVPPHAPARKKQAPPKGRNTPRPHYIYHSDLPETPRDDAKDELSDKDVKCLKDKQSKEYTKGCCGAAGGEYSLSSRTRLPNMRTLPKSYNPKQGTDKFGNPYKLYNIPEENPSDVHESDDDDNNDIGKLCKKFKCFFDKMIR